MISEAEIKLLSEKEPNYIGNLTIKDYMSDKVLSTVIGPTGIGKSATINNALRLHPDWKIVGSTMTRNRRPEDPESYTTADEGMTLEKMAELINNGELVNYSVMPLKGDSDGKLAHIYGTLPKDFPAEVNLFPVQADSIRALQNSGFERISISSLVASTDDWQTMMSGRNYTSDDIHSRMAEAEKSLAYTIGHTDNINVIENPLSPAGPLMAAAELVEVTITGQLAISEREKVRRADLAKRMYDFALRKVVELT